MIELSVLTLVTLVRLVTRVQLIRIDTARGPSE
jgi:hypothetical protein